jgi:hypothetical protein
MTTDSELDIIEESLEPMEAVQSDVLGRRTGSPELVLHVVGLRRLEKNVVASDSHNPVADVALLVVAFVEEEADAALGIRPFGGGNGDSEGSSEGTTNVHGSVVVEDGTQKWWTDRVPKDRLPPLDLDALDSIALEKAKDVLGYVVGGIGGGRAGINPNPYNDGTRHVLLVGFVGDETSHINGRVANFLGFDQVANKGTHSTPDGVERGTINTPNRLGSAIGLGALGLDEGVLFAPSTVEEKRVVIRDAQVVRRRLKLRDSMSRVIVIVREERELREVAQGGGRAQGRASVLAGEFDTREDKCRKF